MHSLERIGRYRLERPLGSGAFATVWLAHDDELQAPVAVKVLAENWAHRLDIRDRFLSEARLLRRAGSNRVVQVYDIGELPDGRPYFVMEYADGGTLADVLEGGALPVGQALALTAEAARAAAALHEAGIVHRDIKPTNVLLHTAPDGTRRVLLADLGLAKSLAQASVLTLAAGSAGYQPPEQAEPGEGIDERADVYSLGAVGYELVTGSVPGPPGRVVPPGRLRPGLGEEVARALLRALEPDRARRWPGAQAFADELDRLAAGPPALRPTRRLDGVRGRLNTVTLSLAALLAAAAAAAGVTMVLHRGGSTDQARVTDSTGRVVVKVPAGWSHELRDSGWDPGALGLAKGHEPGLVVADDLTRWPDLRAAVNGVFVGVSEHGDVTARVKALAHSGCRFSGSRSFSDADWHGLVRAWSGCPDGGSVTESALDPAGGAEQPQVYVQVRERGDKDATEDILRSLSVT
ncbi:serine/threonine protein kinase [Streptomyces yokosukanensis]|uniref:non-specific serine/threonine protein kinase n=1 Tax=Streptomyces yokosukanensis TaxID=67386 RepID=A0A117PZ45_9ACTN|nr:serine/threonine-protein kinase [Streptomyces yokosukanensis]KUM99815.1 serine/threonine protein kinase [Streptomyces yokosukanensis]